ncbi:MAG: thioredoxin [Bacteroidetes bacterium]|nr:MAG: thioredoxin [Bacteroidota bacterium]
MSKFKELINGETPVLVDFYADWCGPCKMLSPIIKDVANELKGKVKVIKVDVDRNQQAAAVYGIRGVPTMILFKKGQIVWRQSGVMLKEQIIQSIQPFLN